MHEHMHKHMHAHTGAGYYIRLLKQTRISQTALLGALELPETPSRVSSTMQVAAICSMLHHLAHVWCSGFPQDSANKESWNH